MALGDLVKALHASTRYIDLNFPPLDALIDNDGTFLVSHVNEVVSIVKDYIVGIVTGTRMETKLKEYIPDFGFTLRPPRAETWEFRLD